ncbi:MAG: hypothetical protein ACXABY_11255 [Candidatus Thorarchaeota archaeon]|jgi:metal-responsive CopG/Arc/MetJ family transcriptional regulator
MTDEVDDTVSVGVRLSKGLLRRIDELSNKLTVPVNRSQMLRSLIERGIASMEADLLKKYCDERYGV